LRGCFAAKRERGKTGGDSRFGNRRRMDQVEWALMESLGLAAFSTVAI
jgi:hypothetical protein